jgi:pimeloyl-ACP methyl ester carboxylesterase
VSDPLTRTALLDGAPVTFTDEGQGPAVVLLHGLPGSARDFRYLAPQMPDVRVIRINLPGFGGTARRGRRAWTLPERATLVIALLDHLGVNHFVLVGHSMGGAVAAAVVAACPARVHGLALLASPGFWQHASYRRSHVRWVARVLALPGAQRVLRKPIRRAFIAAGFPRSLSDEHLHTTMFDAAMLDFTDHARRLRGVQVPCLVAWTDDDPLVEASIGQALADQLPDGPRLHWSEGGHNIQKVHAASLGPALSDFATHALDVSSR